MEFFFYTWRTDMYSGGLKSLQVVSHLLGVGIIFEHYGPEYDKNPRDIMVLDYEREIFFTKANECIFEAAPFAILQTYIIFVHEEYSVETLLSSLVSFMSIGLFGATLNDQSECSSMKFVIKVIVYSVDVALRIITVSFFFKVCTSTMIKLCVTAAIVVVYILVSFCYTKKDDTWMWKITYFAGCLFFSMDGNDTEPLLRHASSIAFMIFGLFNAAIPMWLFVLGSVLCGLFILRSIWRLIG